MRTYFLFAVILTATNTLGQRLPGASSQHGALPGVSLKHGVFVDPDTTLRISYIQKIPKRKLPAHYLNGKRVNQEFIDTIDPQLIESINVDKDSIKLENVTYYGQIHIKTKSSYDPKIASLTELKEKYTNLGREPAIFLVDGEIVTSNYDDYMVDEKLLWRIFVDKVENEEEHINVKFIKLLTKSKENLKKPQVIRIRGTEVGLRNN